MSTTNCHSSAGTEGRAPLHGRTGRPLGGDVFLAGLEVALGRAVRPGKPGPKP